MKRVGGMTPYQFEVIQVVGSGSESEPVDFDQLLERLSWTPKKEAAQFTIRAVIAKGLMVKTGPHLRRGRRRVGYVLTKEGSLVLDPRGASSDSVEAEKGVEEKALKVAPEPELSLVPGSLEGLLEGLEGVEILE